MTDVRDSALIVVDMQNDFLHPDGGLGQIAREMPSRIDMPFITSTTPNVQRLAEAFRQAGRPVVYVVQRVKSDYSDAQFPYWRLGLGTDSAKPFVVEGTWGAEIVEALRPQTGDHVVVKKGYGGFSNTPLDTILRAQGVSTCVVVGVTTCVCVSTTIRGGVEHNYRMIVVSDAVAEVNRHTHAAELETLARNFADVFDTDQVVATLASGVALHAQGWKDSLTQV
jgi:nicotinamidase-related amidase